MVTVADWKSTLRRRESGPRCQPRRYRREMLQEDARREESRGNRGHREVELGGKRKRKIKVVEIK